MLTVPVIHLISSCVSFKKIHLILFGRKCVLVSLTTSSYDGDVMSDFDKASATHVVSDAKVGMLSK